MSDCGVCGMPEGECYLQCPNSPGYYSAEQEAADEPWYGMYREDWDPNAAAAKREAEMLAAQDEAEYQAREGVYADAP